MIPIGGVNFGAAPGQLTTLSPHVRAIVLARKGTPDDVQARLVKAGQDGLCALRSLPPDLVMVTTGTSDFAARGAVLKQRYGANMGFGLWAKSLTEYVEGRFRYNVLLLPILTREEVQRGYVVVGQATAQATEAATDRQVPVYGVFLDGGLLEVVDNAIHDAESYTDYMRWNLAPDSESKIPVTG